MRADKRLARFRYPRPKALSVRRQSDHGYAKPKALENMDGPGSRVALVSLALGLACPHATDPSLPLLQKQSQSLESGSKKKTNKEKKNLQELCVC